MPGSDIRKMWENFPFPLQFSVYVFNITNPAEFTDGKKVFLKFKVNIRIKNKFKIFNFNIISQNYKKLDHLFLSKFLKILF